MSKKNNTIYQPLLPINKSSTSFKKFRRKISKVLKDPQINHWKKIKQLKSELDFLFRPKDSVEIWLKQNYLMKKLKNLDHSDDWSYRTKSKMIPKSKRKNRLILKLPNHTIEDEIETNVSLFNHQIKKTKLPNKIPVGVVKPRKENNNELLQSINTKSWTSENT